MKNDVKETRNLSKRMEDKKAAKRYANEIIEDLQKRYVSVSEAVEALEEYYKRRAAYPPLTQNNYKEWVDYRFIREYRDRYENNCVNDFCKNTAPECFGIIEERFNYHELLKNTTEDVRKKNPYSYNKIKQYRQAAKEMCLYDLRTSKQGRGYIPQEATFDRELLELLNESGNEVWECKHTPRYLYAMAVVYYVLKSRGLEPTPENEEKLKYEILEKEVLKLTGGSSEKHEHIDKDFRDNFIFPDIAELYIGWQTYLHPQLIEVLWGTDHEVDTFHTVAKNKDGVPDYYSISYLDMVWKFFKEETLRTLLHVTTSKGDIAKLFGITPGEVTYEKVMADEQWKNYVFKPAVPIALGGERSPMKINPPLMFEALIDRTVRLKKECSVFEESASREELLKNKDYVRKRREYLVTKLQVIIMDSIRAKDMKKYDSTPESERNRTNKTRREFEGIITLWTEQLGKYVSEWLHRDYQAASFKSTENNKEIDSAYTYYKKAEIALELIEINQALRDLGIVPYEYWQDFPYVCYNETKNEWNKEKVKFDRRKDTSKKDLQYILDNKNMSNPPRDFTFNYDSYIYTDEIYPERHMKPLEGVSYDVTERVGIVRFSPEYLANEKKMIEDANAGFTLKTVEYRKHEDELKELFAKYEEYGVSADAMMAILNETKNNESKEDDR